MESNFELIFEPQFTKDYRKLINTTKKTSRVFLNVFSFNYK